MHANMNLFTLRFTFGVTARCKFQFKQDLSDYAIPSKLDFHDGLPR
jgi:hypothetical protein